MRWAEAESLLKIVKFPVADDVLPNGVSGVVADVKINAHGPDDAVYDKNEMFRNRVSDNYRLSTRSLCSKCMSEFQTDCVSRFIRSPRT